MRIAYYAPLKPPTHAVPSGDRRVARLLIDALVMTGHNVELASTLRTYEPAGDVNVQARLRDAGAQIANDLIARWSGACRDERPDFGFPYHVYPKAPARSGPALAPAPGPP